MTALALYRAGTHLAAPFLSGLLRRRLSAGKEDPARIGERKGIPARQRPPGPMIWLHAASVGESLSALSLISRLLSRHPDLHILVTTGTVTSAGLLATRLPERSFHQFVPLDVPAWCRRFVDHWQPDLVLWMESELWPNMLREIRRRDTDIVLVNARMSSASFANWRRVPGIAKSLLDHFSLCFAQSEEQAERLRQLGAQDVVCVGNLKFSADPLPADGEDLETLGTLLAGRTLLLWASTHDGEEGIAGRLHQALKTPFPDLLTVIVPRHPARAEAISGELGATALTVKRRSIDEVVDSGTDIYLADTMGELGLFYRLATVAIVGGSFVPHGGHNPLEPAQLDCAVLFGSDMSNFQAVADELRQAGAALSCADESALARDVRDLLSHEEKKTALATAAKTVADAHRNVVDRIVDRLAPFREIISRRHSP